VLQFLEEVKLESKKAHMTRLRSKLFVSCEECQMERDRQHHLIPLILPKPEGGGAGQTVPSFNLTGVIPECLYPEKASTLLQ